MKNILEITLKLLNGLKNEKYRAVLLLNIIQSLYMTLSCLIKSSSYYFLFNLFSNFIKSTGFGQIQNDMLTCVCLQKILNGYSVSVFNL